VPAKAEVAAWETCAHVGKSKTSEARDLLEGVFTLLASAEPRMLETFAVIQSKVTATVPAVWQHKCLS